MSGPDDGVWVLEVGGRFYLYADQAAAMREAPSRRRSPDGWFDLETYNIALVPFGVDIKTYMRRP